MRLWENSGDRKEKSGRKRVSYTMCQRIWAGFSPATRADCRLFCETTVWLRGSQLLGNDGRQDLKRAEVWRWVVQAERWIDSWTTDLMLPFPSAHSAHRLHSTQICENVTKQKASFAKLCSCGRVLSHTVGWRKRFSLNRAGHSYDNLCTQMIRNTDQPFTSGAIFSTPHVVALRITSRLSLSLSHTLAGGGVFNQNQLTSNRQYKSTGGVKDVWPGSSNNKRHFYLCFSKILRYNEWDRSGAIVWVICRVIFCLVITEYYSTIVDVTGQLWLMLVLLIVLILVTLACTSQKLCTPLDMNEKD